jgi:DNA-directed RNA polymerase subunit P
MPEVPSGRRPPQVYRRVGLPPLRIRLRRRGVPAHHHDIVQAGAARDGRDRDGEGGGGGLTVYKCAKCLEPIRTNINTVGIQCERCGSKIFYKERPNVKKIVKAR